MNNFGFRKVSPADNIYYFYNGKENIPYNFGKKIGFILRQDELEKEPEKADEKSESNIIINKPGIMR